VGDELGQEQRAPVDGGEAQRRIAPAADVRLSAIARARPDFSTAVPNANAAATDRMIFQSTLRRAIELVQQRLRIMAPAASIAALSIPRAVKLAARIITSRMASAVYARSWRTGRGIGDAADEVEVVRVPLPLGERRVRLEEQRVARAKHDVADLPLDALAAPGHRDDDGVIDGPEASVADGLADQRALRRDDGSIRQRRKRGASSLKIWSWRAGVRESLPGRRPIPPRRRTPGGPWRAAAPAVPRRA